MLIRLTEEEFKVIQSKLGSTCWGDTHYTNHSEFKHDDICLSEWLNSRVVDDSVGIFYMDYSYEVNEYFEKEKEYWTLKLDISNGVVELHESTKRFISDLRWIIKGRDDNEGSWLHCEWYHCNFFIGMLEEKGILKDHTCDGCSNSMYGYLADGVSEEKLDEVLSFNSVYAYLLELSGKKVQWQKSKGYW